MAEADQEKSPTRVVKSSRGQNLMSEVYTGTAEKTIQESAHHAASLLKPYNPDDLWQKAGNYDIYEDMVNDDQVSVCLRLKKDLVINNGWDIVPGDEGQDEIVQDLEAGLGEDPTTPLDEQLEEVLTAYDFGLSLSEKLFKLRNDGSLTFNQLKTRHPDTWIVHTDKRGNIEKYVQVGNTGSDLKINPKSLIHYVVNRRFQNPYGTSDLRSAYAAWFAKRQVIRYYAIYLEKAASPIPIARYDMNAPDDAVDDLHNAIKKFQTKTCLAIPKEVEIEFLEAKTNGEAYEKAINIFNMFIGRALFVPDLIGLQGRETTGGAQSLGREQIDIFLRHIQRRRVALENIVNHHIIKPLIMFNYGDIENPPKFRLRPVREDTAMEAAKLWVEASKGRVYKPNDEEVNHFRKIIKFPEGEVERAKEPQPPMGGDPNIPNGDNKPLNKEAKPEPGAAKPEDEPKKDSFSLAVVEQFKAPDGEFYKRTDFRTIEASLDNSEASLMRAARPLIDAIFEDLYDQLERKKILEKRDVARLDTLKLKNLKSMKQVLKMHFRLLHNQSKEIAAGELLKQSFATPLPSEEFLQVLDDETFQYIGDWSYNVTRGARTAMQEAVRDGLPLSSVIDLLDSKGKRDSLVSLERYSRTKHTEVMNRGRQEFFESTGIVAGYQYSAIMDSRTTVICAGLHGKTFVKGTEPVPPMHFNCRSTIIPITIFEDFEADTKVGGQVLTSGNRPVRVPHRSIQEHIDKEKGKGFSAR